MYFDVKTNENVQWGGDPPPYKQARGPSRVRFWNLFGSELYIVHCFGGRPIFKSDHFLQDADASEYLRSQMQQESACVPPFGMDELRCALKIMKTRKGADEYGVVLEMFKHAFEEYLQLLLDIFNTMLRTSEIDPTWRETLFSMLPKSGNLGLVPFTF